MLQVPGGAQLLAAIPRLLLGFSVLFVTRAVLKPVGTFVCESVLGVRGVPLPAAVTSSGDGGSKAQRYAVELPTKLLTYGAIGFNAVATVPLLMTALGLK